MTFYSDVDLFDSNESVIPVADNLVQALSLLDSDKQFVHFNLGFTNDEISSLEQLTVTNSNPEQFFRNFNSFNSDFEKYFQSLGNNELISLSASSIVGELVNQFAEEIKNHSSVDTLNILSSASTIDPSYYSLDNAWHVDGYDGDDGDNHSYKVVFRLIGPGTLFCKLSKDNELELRSMLEDSLSKIREIGSLSEDEGLLKSNLEGMDEFRNLCDPKKGHIISETPKYHGTVFMNGYKGAIHRIPTVTSERIFISLEGITDIKN